MPLVTPDQARRAERLPIAFIRRIETNTWLLLLVSISWLSVNIRWIAAYRRDHILEIDEAGYLAMAISDQYAALRDGLPGWVRAVEWPGIQAPLTPSLTSLQFLLTRTSVLAAFAVPLLAGLAVVLLTYALTVRLGGRRLAWAALLLVATAPGIIIESRAYHFGVPVAAVTTGALYCLVRSERLSRTGFSIGFGILLGLMPLTRTMALAFMPGLILAAVLQAAIGPDRRKRLIRCAAAIAVAVGVAATWLGPNGRLVYRYLTDFGYGRQSEEYGGNAGVLNPAAWFDRVRSLLAEQYLPHTVIVLAGLFTAIYVVFRRAHADRLPRFLRTATTSPAMPVFLFVAIGLAAFVSSRTNGNGFTLPLLPATVVIAVWGLSRAHEHLRRALPVLVTLVGLLALVPLLDLSAPTARPWTLDVPGVGHVTITDGRGVPQRYVGRGVPSDEPAPISAETARQWVAINDWGAQQIVDRGAVHGTTAFGMRDLLFNTNTVQLAMLRERGYGVGMAGLRPSEAGSTEADYRRWLTERQDGLSGDASTACLLFTATETINEFQPPTDPIAMARAAESAGFTTIATRMLPNGRMLTLWHRGHPTCE